MGMVLQRHQEKFMIQLILGLQDVCLLQIINVWYSNEFVAHFGWNNATKVYFTGILGSMYSYEW